MISIIPTHVTYKSTPQKDSEERAIIFNDYLDTDNKKTGHKEIKPYLRAQIIVLCNDQTKAWPHPQQMRTISLA